MIGRTSPPHVLITSAAAKVPLIQGFQEALQDNGKVYSADITGDCAAACFSDGHFVVARNDAPEALEQLLDLCVMNGIGLLVPTRDGELPALAAARERFALQGVFIHVGSLETVSTCQNKRVFGRFLLDRGFQPVPLLDPASSNIPFPAFVRPVSGSAGRGARSVGSPRELAEALAADDCLVHPLIQAPEYSIDLLMDLEGKRALDAVCRERIHVVAGESKISRVTDLPYLTAMAKRVGEALGLIGHNTVQAFFDAERGPLFIEVNPRFGGASNLSIRAGLDSPRRILQMIRGDETAYRPKKIAFGATMFRYSQDVITGI